MIPIFFCHICGTNGNCNLVIKLAEKLTGDIEGIDPFVACQNERWNSAKDLNASLSQSYIFIPIVSPGFKDRNNCTSELAQTRNRKQFGKFPLIIPIKFNCGDALMNNLGFTIDQETEQGDKWIDFSNEVEFDSKYEELYRRIHYWSIDNDLVTNKDFHKDRKVLDVILGENDPTSSQIKIAIDYCRKGQEYSLYFLKNLSNPKWLSHLYASGFFAFNPVPVESEKNEGFYSIPLWAAVIFLEKIAVGLGKKDKERMLDIIRKVSKPAPPAVKQDNWRTWQSFVKILSKLQIDDILSDDIEMIAEWLYSKFDTSMVVIEIGKTLLPKVLTEVKTAEDANKVVRIIQIVLDSVRVERRHGMMSHGLQKMFKNNSDLLGEKCGLALLEIIRNKLESVVEEKDDAYCYIWRPAIEDSEQNVASDEYRHILIAGFRDIYLKFASFHNAETFLQSCYESPRDIIQRIAFYVIGKLFDKYKKLAEEILLKDANKTFLKSNYHHELYFLITKHFTLLSTDVQSSVIDIISGLTGDWKDDSDKDRLNCMLRRRWLYAVKQSGYNISNELEDKYFKDIEYKPEHPEFLSYIGPVSWGDESMFSSAELLSKGGIEEMVTFLNNFEGKNRFGETAIREAGQSFKEAIKNKQEVFDNHLLEFKKLKYEYWYYAVQAFEELVQDKKTIGWEKVLEFCNEIILSEILWDGKGKKSDYPLEPKKDWIPAVISDLLRKGLQEDSIIFTESQYGLIDKVVRVLLDKQPSTASGDDKDALTEAINTTKGHVLECLKSYVLRRYRDFERLPDKGIREKESFWKEVEPLFVREIEGTKEGSFEFSSLSGAYLPNLYYLNKDWVTSNINNIFPTEEKHWRCAMQGYSYVNTVYAVIYNILRDNGHLKRALDTKFSNDQTRSRIIENIAVSYLRGQETIDGQNSLFKYILEKWNHDDIEEIISLFWSHRDVELDCEQKARIFNFWRHCFNQIKGKEDAHKDILSDLNLLAVFFDPLTAEQVDWLRQSVKYVEERYHSSFLLEYFDKLAENNPKDVGNVFLIMLEKTIPWYKQENIQSVVEKFYKADLKNEIANPICDKYARAGFEFLIEVYQKYNKK
ncbi:MAG: hypothetical protein Q7K98_07660 [Candidatus Omnitrophota bacterium]|nr:hypothetical protein [Candidatus Omnitrophota bacterium]